MSKHVLVTMLGKSSRDRNTGYERARYRFPDGSERETPFFGLALCEHLQPDRVVVFGTRSSMWDTLVEHVAADGTEEELRLRLMDACRTHTVDQALLDSAMPLLARATGRPTVARLIDFSADTAAQVAILQSIADAIGPDEASIDVTHGFRHLGMLGLSAAFVLGMAKSGSRQQGSVRDVWYGAFDMRQDHGAVPVLLLDGMLLLQDWVTALARFEENGNYAVFAPLLEQDGAQPDIARCLRDAWFQESNLNLRDARESLRRADRLLRATPLPGIGELFRKRLLDRLDWIKRDNLQEWQNNLAHKALARGDYLRAAIFGTEAVISRACVDRGRDPFDPEARKSVKAELNDERQDQQRPDPRRRAFATLNGVRNAMAHAMPAQYRRVNELLGDEKRLRKEMHQCLIQLAEP
jgi:CRISPR-associated Csx2 family protein